ncbi:MAG: class I SAM-dependent methyltransferase [Oligoflexia bacterium]
MKSQSGGQKIDWDADSESLDLSLGFRVFAVEAEVAVKAVGQQAELWSSKGPAVFQTPYAELRAMMTELALPPGSRLVDLGCAYGRLGIVVAQFFPEIEFTGFEISVERVAEARRVYSELGLDPRRVVEADLSGPEFQLPGADAYFIFDYGTRSAVQKTLDDLSQIARSESRPFVVVGRGRRVRDLIERNEPWLSQVHAPRHCGNFSIYFSSAQHVSFCRKE